MARPELGSKHLCENCGARFFDLNRSPIACPKCGTVLQSAARAVQHAAESEDEDVPAGPDTGLVSLEEADAEEEKATATPEDEVEIDTDDDTFLEEEEEDDGNVGDLIDSDMGDDEER
ncbi:MAG: TIGR02300 family protein [Methylocapsa sp.]|nr:TIGR02300 family protein [Methylocapsa sp.]